MRLLLCGYLNKTINYGYTRKAVKKMFCNTLELQGLKKEPLKRVPCVRIGCHFAAQ